MNIIHPHEYLCIKKMPDLLSSWEFCGGFHTGFFRIPRALWISGESVPPALSRRSFARFARSAGFPAWLPCPIRKLSVSYFYTAGLGGDPLLLCEDGALTFRTRGEFLVSSRTPALAAGKPPPTGVSLHFLDLL